VSQDVTRAIARRLEWAGASLGDGQLGQLSSYFGLMAKWNNRINLTSLDLADGNDAAIDRLLVEPVVASRHVHRTDEFLIDLGSGGGSPAIPMKIALPWVRLVMVESKARKAAFLRDACRELKLADTTVENSRFEDLSSPDFQATADVVSVRAVRADRQLWDVALRLLKPGGHLLWFTVNDSPDLPAPSFQFVTSDSPLPTGSSRLVILRRGS